LQAAEASKPLQAAASRNFKGVKVLVCEDNAVNQKVKKYALERLGCETQCAANGREAVDAVRARPFDLILMDCQMPEMDGYEASQAIRQWEGNARRTPIVALTAAAFAEDRERCLAAGMDGHLAKPLDWDELAGALDRFLRVAKS
jgi:CheY-like chemotaxis protein